MNKNYLIIGGSSGIGLNITKQLSEEGNSVYVASRSNESLSGIQNTFHIELDVTSADEFDLSQAIPEKLDGLVYAPGTINLKPFHRLKIDDFRQEMEINHLGAVKMIQATLTNLKKSDLASIVMFSTIAVQTGMGFHAYIASAKGAVEGLIRSLAAEFAPKIRVNGIAPSLVDTPLAEKLLNTDKKKEASADRHPLKSYGDTNDIANAAIYLLSDKSKWMTGQILHIDGGMSSIR